jgi:hypothetical protein
MPGYKKKVMIRVCLRDFAFSAEEAVDAVKRVNFDDAVFFCELFHFVVWTEAEVSINQYYPAGRAEQGFLKDLSQVLLQKGIIYVEVLADENRFSV